MKLDRKHSTGLILIKIFVFLYDVISFPIYYLIQKPWKVLELSNQVRAKQEDPNDPYSPWVRIGKRKHHYLMSCKTMSEGMTRVLQIYGTERSGLGYRKILGEDTETLPNGKVMKKLILSDYKWLTMGEVNDRIDNIGRGLLLNGVKPKEPVLIFAETRIEWFLTAHAILRIGASIATLYATLGTDGIVHGINETEVTHIVTTQDLLPKLSKLKKRTPKVNTIIYVEGLYPLPKNEFDDSIKLISLTELENAGKTAPEDLTGVMPTPNDTAVILYTSGSTGVPKGVVITHKNFMSACSALLSVVETQMDNAHMHSYLAYLPLAHSLEFTAETFLYCGGVKIGYGTPLTMTDAGTAVRRGEKGDASLLRPTIMAGVPLILDRIRKGIYDNLEKRGLFAKELFDFLIAYKIWWEKRGFTTKLINRFICKRINGLVGGNLQFMLCGSAPLSPDTQRIIRSSLNIRLLQGYGSTETSAAATCMDFDDISSGKIGAPLYGAKIKMVDWEEGGYRVTDKPNPRGELIIGGDFISMGYYKLEDQTNEAFTHEDGVTWFHSGDIGEVFPDGIFKIIDRKKDLIKLQFGEYISLGKVESELKSSPYIDNICVYGDSFQLYIIALIVPNAKALKRLAEELGIKNDKIADLCKDLKIIEFVTKEIIKHGTTAGLHKTEIPAKIKLCSDEWNPDSGLVTAALKLKRKNIQDFYQSDINRMYGNGQNNNVNGP